MTGNVRKESLYHNVREYMESDDGKLYGISRSFWLKRLVGRTDILDGKPDGILLHFSISATVSRTANISWRS